MIARTAISIVAAVVLTAGAGAVPVKVEPVAAKHGMVVAAHPQAAAAGLAILRAGGNAVDAAVATSLATGVAEPYGSGLGGKLMLLFFEAKSGRAYAVEAMDAAGSLDVAAYLRRPEADRSLGYGAVCVPGLGAGLWAAHERWGGRPWAELVEPAIALAREGSRVLPKTRDLFEEQEKKLRQGDPEIARLYLPGGKLPEPGALLPNPDLARTLERLARHGRDGFYRGPVAEMIVAATRAGGGVLTLEDFAAYEPRVTEPIAMEFRGHVLVCAPPPASGAALFLPMLKVLEEHAFGGDKLRSPENLDTIGRTWRAVFPRVGSVVGDAPESRFRCERLLAPDTIAELRARVFEPAEPQRKVAGAGGEPPAIAAESPFHESEAAATTHWLVIDREGNVVCATQSQSMHFGAGVVPPGTGVVLNNTMSNFAYGDPEHINFVAPGKRPRSTISPTLVLRAGRPVLALGLPGGSRIPTTMMQVLLDHFVFRRSLADAIGDTRVHFFAPWRSGDTEALEAEESLPAEDAAALRARGWKVVLAEEAGRGRYFGGVNAIAIAPDGALTGYADPRRTNVALGW